MHDDFQAGETRGNCSSISQWCQPLTTTMTEKVRFLKWLYLYCHILTDLRSLLAYEPGIILYLWKWKNNRRGFFFPKQNGNINWRQTLLFICARFLQCCTYGFGDLGTYTFPLFYHLWTVIWLTIHSASRLLWQVPWPVHTRLVRALHVVSGVHRHC